MGHYSIKLNDHSDVFDGFLIISLIIDRCVTWVKATQLFSPYFFTFTLPIEEDVA